MLYFKFQSKLVGLVLFSVFSVFLFTSNILAQQDKLVENLDILGNRRLTDEEILRHIKTHPGEKFDEKQMQADLQSLLKLGFFNPTNTRVSTEEGLRGGVNVIFEVMELPLIVELNFNGLRYLTDKDILAELREQKVEVKVGEPFEAQKLQRAQSIITEYLVKRGFANAKVYVTTEDVSATTVKISFVINEQPNNDEDNNEK